MKFILLCICVPLLQLTAANDESFFENKVRPLLNKYCFDCHDPDDEESESPFLEDLKVADLNKNRHTWESVAAQIRNRTMPPQRKKKQPTEFERIELANWIESYLHKAALEMPEYAGSVLPRRLNRDEYNNTVRDLVGLDLDLSYSFPMDGGGGEGFDNNSETLFLPPLLMEKYLETAQKILDKTIVLPKFHLKYKVHSPAFKKLFNVYEKGKYEVSLNTSEKGVLGKAVLQIDGVKESLTLSKSGQALQAVLTINRGIHEIAVLSSSESANLFDELSIRLLSKPPSKSKLNAHKNIFRAPAGNTAASRRQAAYENIKAFTSRAFRRPVRESELKVFMKLYDRSLERGDPYEAGVKLALKAVLVSPKFLYMIEKKADSAKITPIGDSELASRLSYFLWGSMPDDELFSLAEQKALQNPANLIRQVKRMLQDEKANFFFAKFTGQWLGTKDVGLNVLPRARGIGYTTRIGTAMREEPRHLSTYIFRNNRTLLDYINADYVLVNETLAKHYGIAGIKGEEYRLHHVKNGQRGGILGLGGVHLLTSFPDRTSPVLRGVWVIETILGTPVPPPPDNVPELNLVKHKKKMTIRQIFEAHRKNDACAACHNLIDPIGFGMENYNLIGKWRTDEDGKPLDASGTMPSGETFDGPEELKKIILKQKEKFIKHLSSKMLGYALGRSIRMEDSGTLERMVDKIKESHFSSQELIEQIVLSTPFRNRQLVLNSRLNKESH